MSASVVVGGWLHDRGRLGEPDRVARGHGTPVNRIVGCPAARVRHLPASGVALVCPPMFRGARHDGASMSGAGLMAGSMLLWSVLPLVIDVLVGAQRRPLTVGAGIAAGFGVGSLLIRRLHPAYGHAELSAAGTWRRCRAMGRSAVPDVVVPVAVTSIGAFGYVAFAWSSAHIDTAVTSSLYQLWPVM